ncbi:MAG: acyltransferase, partial [Bacteroidetes bacterium]
MPIMILSIVQTNPSFGDIRSNVDDALALMRSVKADLFVLPELFNTGYNFVTMDEVIKLSEDDSGYTMQAMLDFAKTNNCYCVFGYAEQA